jgi:hypothetical protein
MDLEDVIDNFEVRVEVSDPITSATDYLDIDFDHIRLFTNPGAAPPLAGFLKDVELRRSFYVATGWDSQLGRLIGITSIAADPRLNPLAGVFIDFFDGYDESIFRTVSYVSVVSQTVFSMLDHGKPILRVAAYYVVQDPISIADDEYIGVEASFLIVGIVRGAGNDVYAPFWTVAELGKNSASRLKRI